MNLVKETEEEILAKLKKYMQTGFVDLTIITQKGGNNSLLDCAILKKQHNIITYLVEQIYSPEQPIDANTRNKLVENSLKRFLDRNPPYYEEITCILNAMKPEIALSHIKKLITSNDTKEPERKTSPSSTYFDAPIKLKIEKQSKLQELQSMIQTKIQGTKLSLK